VILDFDKHSGGTDLEEDTVLEDTGWETIGFDLDNFHSPDSFLEGYIQDYSFCFGKIVD